MQYHLKNTKKYTKSILCTFVFFLKHICGLNSIQSSNNTCDQQLQHLYRIYFNIQNLRVVIRIEHEVFLSQQLLNLPRYMSLLLFRKERTYRLWTRKAKNQVPHGWWPSQRPQNYPEYRNVTSENSLKKKNCPITEQEHGTTSMWIIWKKCSMHTNKTLNFRVSVCWQSQTV